MYRPDDCHICKRQVDIGQGLQCNTCDVWIHLACMNVNNTELEIFESIDIPFLCPRCEWNGTDLLDMDIVPEININVDITVDILSILEPPLALGVSIAYLNGLDIEERKDEIKYIFQNKPF